MRQWWIQREIGAFIQGPLADAEVLELLKSGQLTRDWLVSQDGVQWRRSGEVFARMFATIPQNKVLSVGSIPPQDGRSAPAPEPNRQEFGNPSPGSTKTSFSPSRPRRRRSRRTPTVALTLLLTAIAAAFAVGVVMVSYTVSGRGATSLGGSGRTASDARLGLKVRMISALLDDPLHHTLPSGDRVLLSEVRYQLDGQPRGVIGNPVHSKGVLPLVIRFSVENTSQNRLLYYRGLNNSRLGPLRVEPEVVDDFGNRYSLIPIIEVPIAEGSGGVTYVNPNPVDAVSEPLELEPGVKVEDWIAIHPKSPIFNSDSLTIEVPLSFFDQRGSNLDVVKLEFRNPVRGKRSVPLR